jgi:hypothetical protein
LFYKTPIISRVWCIYAVAHILFSHSLIVEEMLICYIISRVWCIYAVAHILSSHSLLVEEMLICYIISRVWCIYAVALILSSHISIVEEMLTEIYIIKHINRYICTKSSYIVLGYVSCYGYDEK